MHILKQGPLHAGRLSVGYLRTRETRVVPFVYEKGAGDRRVIQLLTGAYLGKRFVRKLPFDGAVQPGDRERIPWNGEKFRYARLQHSPQTIVAQCGPPTPHPVMVVHHGCHGHPQDRDHHMAYVEGTTGDITEGGRQWYQCRPVPRVHLTLQLHEVANKSSHGGFIRRYFPYLRATQMRRRILLVRSVQRLAVR